MIMLCNRKKISSRFIKFPCNLHCGPGASNQVRLLVALHRFCSHTDGFHSLKGRVHGTLGNLAQFPSVLT